MIGIFRDGTQSKYEGYEWRLKKSSKKFNTQSTFLSSNKLRNAINL